MTKQETYVNFIIEQLQSGNIVYKDVMSLFVSKWQLSERQFVRYWNIANERHLESQKKLQKEKDALYSDAQKEAVKSNILQKHEALEILSKIAKGTAKKIGEQVIIPSATEQRGAIETMAKIEGWMAPTKQDIRTNLGAEEIVIKRKRDD